MSGENKWFEEGKMLLEEREKKPFRLSSKCNKKISLPC